MPSVMLNLPEARERTRQLEEVVLRLTEKYAEFPDYANELAAPFVERLQLLRAEIDRALGISPLSTSDAVLHIRTSDDLAGGPRASLLIDSLSTFRTALTRVTASLRGQARTGPGRQPEQLRSAADFRVTGIAPGSLKIGVTFVRPVHQEALPEFTAGPSVEEDLWKAVSIIWQASRAVNAEVGASNIEVLLPDSQIRQVVLREIVHLSPGVRGRVSSIDLEGNPGLPLGSVVLTSRTRVRALDALYPGVRVEDFDDTGVFRAVDVDRDSSKHNFVLRQRPEGRPDVDGDFDESLRFVIMDAVDRAHRVRVRGALETHPSKDGRAVLHIDSVESV
jgi:hypothetical protein